MTSTPLDPKSPGSFEAQGKKRSYFRIVAIIVAVHVVFLGGLLIQGCKPDDTKKTASVTPSATTNEPGLPPENPNYYKSAEPLTNAQNSSSNGFAASASTNYPAPDAAAVSNAVAQSAGNAAAELAPSAAGGHPAGEYEIKAGDTLAKVAKAQGVGVKALIAANPGIDPAKLKIGQKIQVPASTAAANAAPGAGAGGTAKAAESSSASSASASNYEVKQGDSLIKIAKSHGISVKTLKAANGLKTDRIHAGQKLKVPAATGAAASAATANAPKPHATGTNAPTSN